MFSVGFDLCRLFIILVVKIWQIIYLFFHLGIFALTLSVFYNTGAVN